jgi:hypothetical protein
MFAKRILPKTVGCGIVGRGDAAYGLSQIDSSTRRGKEIDLWIKVNQWPGRWQPVQNSSYPWRDKIKVDRWRRNV